MNFWCLFIDANEIVLMQLGPDWGFSSLKGFFFPITMDSTCILYLFLILCLPVLNWSFIQGQGVKILAVKSEIDWQKQSAVKYEFFC